MTGDRNQRRLRPPSDDRGQTVHDYLIGVSLLLITLFGVFAFVPGMFQPFSQPVGADKHAAAERVGERLVSDHALPGEQNTINGTAYEDTVKKPGMFTDMLDRAGVNQSLQFVNVTLSHPNGTRLDDRWGRTDPESEYHVETTTAATTVRIVEAEGIDGCDPVCRIVVRVW